MNDKPKLAHALLEAQRAIQGVAKDARNEHHRFAYASADAMVGECRTALHSAGLVAYRPSWTLSEDLGVVTCQMALLHAESGEERVWQLSYPLVPDKGRPIDKALAGALSSSLGYWLRDLLLVPRGLDHQVEARDDSQRKSVRRAEMTEAMRASIVERYRRKIAEAPDAAALVALGGEIKASVTDAGAAAALRGPYLERQAELAGTDDGPPDDGAQDDPLAEAIETYGVTTARVERLSIQKFNVPSKALSADQREELAGYIAGLAERS